MCECGCSGNVVEWFKFPAPEGEFYLVGVYPSCHDCETPAGVDFRRVSRKQHMEETGIDLAKMHNLKFHEGMAVLAVVDPAILKRRLVEFLKGAEVDSGVVDEEWAFAFMDDGLKEHFEEAVIETAKENSRG